MKSIHARLSGAALSILLSATTALAQNPTAALTGVVRDSAAVPIDGADVVARNLETGQTYGVLTKGTGRYWLRGLPPGRYDVSAGRIGFATQARRDVVLLVGRTFTLDFELRVEAVEVEPVEALVERPLIETTQADISFVLEREQIDRLPEESREFVDLALLAPGATAASETEEPVATTSLGALNSYNLGVLVDGGNMIGAELNDFTGSVPLLAVQEFEVLTSSYAAEFGQAASGVINAVTRRGTNQLVAQGFVLGRHHSLNALGAYETEKPDYNRRHWGVALGGPITRDRTHYFLAFERKVENLFSTVQTGGVHPEVEGTFKTPLENNLFFARLDQRFSDTSELMVRYAGKLSSFVGEVGGTNSFESGIDYDQTMHSVLANHRWSLGGGVLNETRVHFLRQTSDRTPLAEGAALWYPTLGAGGNFNSWRVRNLRLELKNELSLTATGSWSGIKREPPGTHRLKLGFMLAYVESQDETVICNDGCFFFDSDTASLPMSGLVGLTPWLTLDQSNLQIGLYAQDDWNPVSNLTLRLGLRYDIETNGTNQSFESPLADSLPFVSGGKRPADRNNIAPRLSFAWNPWNDDLTVLRGGFGIFYHQFLLLYPGIESSAFKIAQVVDPGTTDIEDLDLDPDTVPAGYSILGDDLEAPHSRQLSLGFERVLPGNVVLSLDGMYVLGRNLPIKRKLVDYNVDQILYVGEADATILQLRLRKAFSTGRFDVHYTYGKRKATNDSWLDYSPQVDPGSQDFSGEMGPVSWDERHRLVGWVDARLPLDFVVGLKALYASARPYNAVTGYDANGDGIFNDRPPGEGRNGRRSFDDYSTVDLGISKWFLLGGGRFGLTLNIYNLLNRTNYDAKSIVGNLQSSIFGQPLAAHAKRQVELGIQARY